MAHHPVNPTRRRAMSASTAVRGKEMTMSAFNPMKGFPVSPLTVEAKAFCVMSTPGKRFWFMPSGKPYWVLIACQKPAQVSTLT